MDYTWTVESSLYYTSGTKKGTPNGDLLISAHEIGFTPEIALAQFTSGARFQFSKAGVTSGTGLTGYKLLLGGRFKVLRRFSIVDSYKPGNQSLRITTAWIA